MTRDYEMEQIDMAIRYFEKQIRDAFTLKEAEKAKETIDKLNSRYKELLVEKP
tara:strand:+ start:333 stop:491 length:159 start_codon:yes stop_codon:yes gene_type:complete